VKSVAGIADRTFNDLEMLAESEVEKIKAGKGLMLLAGLVILIAGLREAQSVPLTMVLKVILESSDEFRWIGVAISSKQPAGIAEETLLDVTPPENPKHASLSLGAESI
jgi:hypothetical protein